MCIKGPESWWIAKSITPQLVVNQSKTIHNDRLWIDLPLVRFCNTPTFRSFDFYNH